MDTAVGMHVMAYWANWRLFAGGQTVARLIVQTDVRAVSWVTARHLADLAGSAAAAITMGATAGLALHRFRAHHWRPGSSHRSSSPD